jgi:hypothetical protein
LEENPIQEDRMSLTTLLAASIAAVSTTDRSREKPAADIRAKTFVAIFRQNPKALGDSARSTRDVEIRAWAAGAKEQGVVMEPRMLQPEEAVLGAALPARPPR